MEHRKKAGLTQVDVASALGVTKGAISQWENGLVLPKIGFLFRLAEIYSVTSDKLCRSFVFNSKQCKAK